MKMNIWNWFKNKKNQGSTRRTLKLIIIRFQLVRLGYRFVQVSALLKVLVRKTHFSALYYSIPVEKSCVVIIDVLFNMLSSCHCSVFFSMRRVIRRLLLHPILLLFIPSLLLSILFSSCLKLFRLELSAL